MSRIGGAAARWAARLIPARGLDWAEALWAETDQVPPGLACLAWVCGRS